MPVALGDVVSFPQVTKCSLEDERWIVTAVTDTSFTIRPWQVSAGWSLLDPMVYTKAALARRAGKRQ